MLKILVATHNGIDSQGIATLVSGSLSCSIEYLESETDIKVRLASNEIDIYIDEYEVLDGRACDIIDYISCNHLKTTVTILAEPKNFSAAYQNQNESIHFCLLKPVNKNELLFYFQRVADRYLFETGLSYTPTIQELFNRVRILMVNNFWMELLFSRGAFGQIKYLDQAAASVALPRISDCLIYPILYISSNGGRDPNFVNNKQIYESMASALVIRGNEGYTLYISDGTLAILFFPYQNQLSQNQIILRCYQFCEELERQFQLYGTCILGAPCTGIDLPAQWQQLLDYAKNLRFRTGKVFTLDSNDEHETIPHYPQISQWTDSITSGDETTVLNEIKRFYLENEKHAGMTRDLIVSLCDEINRSVTITIMQQNGTIKPSKAVLDLYITASESRENFLQWISALTRWCREQQKQNQSSSILDEAILYIRRNLDSDLKRQSIADHVHVSQNYLARLFRSKLGTTMSDFINDERMQMAAHLLDKTNLPIAEIALRTGFASQTYFSSCFKQRYGKSPRNYRDENSSLNEPPPEPTQLPK